MLKSSVTGLRELVATLRQDRLMEKLKEDNLRFKAKSDESMRRATSIERNNLDVLVFIPLTLPSLFLSPLSSGETFLPLRSPMLIYTLITPL